MKRHPFNVFSLIFGIILIMVAASAAWVPYPAPRWIFDTSDWLIPGAAILVGGALLSPLFTPKQPKNTPGDATESETPGVATDSSTEHP